MKNLKEILISAIALTIIAACVTAALAGTNALTKDTIAAQVEAAQTAARKEVIDADSFEKKTAADFEYYVALKGGETVGYVFTVEETGKSSGLVVMTGVSVDGTVTGVVITGDNETAGYVDKVEKAGLLTAMKDKTDVSNVDTVSQATKTSKGVIAAVKTALEHYKTVTGGGAQ